MMHLSCEETLKSCHGSIVEMLNRNITALDLRQDKACFFKRNEQVYTRPGYFKFMPSKEDIRCDSSKLFPSDNQHDSDAAFPQGGVRLVKVDPKMHTSPYPTDIRLRR
ncbi:unnamed protein product [Schistosoma curassoni]|uniref:DEP domain-containing protein n=1 Tax=Schistosoma curassoni TaxID=6186 RepID=A0A183L758_9TREM|nr:unnamed protein product [Schistosoma curassoni]